MLLPQQSPPSLRNKQAKDGGIAADSIWAVAHTIPLMPKVYRYPNRDREFNTHSLFVLLNPDKHLQLLSLTLTLTFFVLPQELKMIPANLLYLPDLFRAFEPTPVLHDKIEQMNKYQ